MCRKDPSIISEIKKIEIDKWDEGLRTGKDPGNEFVLNWVSNHAKEFRKKWQKSQCSSCSKSLDCGYKLKDSCDGYTTF